MQHETGYSNDLSDITGRYICNYQIVYKTAVAVSLTVICVKVSRSTSLQTVRIAI